MIKLKIALILIVLPSVGLTEENPYLVPDITLCLRQEEGRNEGLFRLRNPFYFLECGMRPSELKSQSFGEVTVSPSRFSSNYHEPWRFGFAFEMDQEDWFWPNQNHRYGAEGRAFFLTRGEFDWGTLKLYYPLAQIHHGEKWPYRARLEDLRLYLVKHQNSSVALTGFLDYRSDSGLQTDWGIYLRRRNIELEARFDGFSLSYTTSMGIYASH